MMKVGMYYNNRDVRPETQDVPRVGPKDILIKVMASGVCGSDIMEWYRAKKAPLVLGHELTGEIVELGKEVKEFNKGDRVFATHHVPCGECSVCQAGHTTACPEFLSINNFTPGGFSEYLRVSGRSIDSGILKLPDKLSFEEGSFIEPLGTVIRGLRAANLDQGKKNKSVLVIGSGIIGLLMIKTARAMGAGKLYSTDLNPFRLEAAKKFGADEVFLAGSETPKADVVMICAGALIACEQALKSVRTGGTVVFFAVPKPGEKIEVDFNEFWRIDVTIKTCYGAAPDDNAKALELISSGQVRVNDMITHRYGLDDIGKAFIAASEGSDCLKVMIDPQSSARSSITS